MFGTRLKRLLPAALLLAPALTVAHVQPAVGARATAAPVTLTYWWWAESDVPGADKWMRQTVALFEKAHPNIQVNLDIQGTDSLISNFQAAAAAHKGPD